MMGNLYIVMGKSATGKDHIYKALLEQKSLALKTVVPYTTRPMRAGETEGAEYHFVSEEQMNQLLANGKIIEKRCYETVAGPWWYFTADDGQMNPEAGSCILIATPEAYGQIRAFFGEKRVVPIYIEVDDAERLRRAIRREEKQENPRFKEVCRRFLADEEDFSEEILAAEGIKKRYKNVDFDACVQEIVEDILAIEDLRTAKSGSETGAGERKSPVGDVLPE